jgi:hypothetical protein
LHLPINENKKNALDTGHSITKGNVDCISKVIVIVIVMLYVPWKTITEKKKKKIRIIFMFYYATNK